MKKILFFDDESFITDMIIDNLQKNYAWDSDGLGEIIYVESPKELFDKVKDENVAYDLFILDIMVPIDLVRETNLFSAEEIGRMQRGDNTGVVFAEKIRSLKKYRDTPILFLSARIKPSKMMPNTDYLEKPPFADDLSEKLKIMLNL